MTDTIAAISTALTNAGIGIVRISGEEAVAVADRIFRTPSGKKLADCPTHTIHYGHAYDGDEVIDEVLAMLMRKPHSYTTEDTVEINCHGGVYVVKRVLSAALKAGARLAEPGEFTRKAFVNGRMDLSQAEAVMELIRSENDYALSASIGQLRGDFSEEIRRLRSEILYQMARIESALDDPEHYTLDDGLETLLPEIKRWREELSALIDSYENGRQRTEGIRTVILGKPNAGKSSILNLLAGEERAIVTEVPGTTRDVLEEAVLLNGISLKILDTAGIRDTQDPVEQIGVKRALQSAESADLILLIADMDAGIDEEDLKIARAAEGKPVIVLFNKSDLMTDKRDPEIRAEEMLALLPEALRREPPILFSATERTGLAELTGRIEEKFFSGKVKYNDQIVVMNIRHRNLCEEAWKSLGLVEESVENRLPEDFYSIDLMDAYEKLGLIIGEEVEDDLADEIFSKFCMGK